MSAPRAHAPQRARLPVRWSLVVATLLTAVAIVALYRSVPTFEERRAPIPVHGRIGEKVVARNFTVEVKRVKLARAYKIAPRLPGDPPRLVNADGTWMSALVEVEALSSAGAIYARLRTRDGQYYLAGQYDRPDLGGSNLNGRLLTTALAGTGGYFFDVDPRRLEGAHLEFFWDMPREPALWDSVIDIDLGLDAQATRKLQADAKPVLDLT